MHWIEVTLVNGNRKILLNLEGAITMDRKTTPTTCTTITWPSFQAVAGVNGIIEHITDVVETPDELFAKVPVQITRAAGATLTAFDGGKKGA